MVAPFLVSLLLRRSQAGQVLSASPKLLKRPLPVLCGRINAETAHFTPIRNAGCQCAMRLDQVELGELPNWT